MLTIENLTIRVSGRTLVDNFQLELSAGDSLGVLGPSGSGKTTFARAVSGLIDKDGPVKCSGTIRIGGIDILADARAASAVRGQGVVLIPQSVMQSMPPYLKIRDLALAVTKSKDAQSTLSQLADILTTIGVREPVRVLQSRPPELAGGERQRALLAITLLKRPKLVVADEPTTALDPITKGLVIEAIAVAREALGFSLILISHDSGLLSRATSRAIKFEGQEITPWSPRIGSKAAGTKPYEKTDEGVRSILGVRNVEVKSGRAAILTDVNLELAPQDSLAVIGASGSGKTTLAKVLSGLIRPSRGEVWARFDGASSRQLSGPTRAIQMIYQDPTSSFDPRMSLQHSITLAANSFSIAGQRRQETLEVFAEQLGIDSSVLERRPHEVSGGECQRAAILRALLCEPSVLIADEFTSNLDPDTSDAVQRLIASVIEENQIAFVLVSHDYDFVRQICTHTAVLEDGYVVEYGITKDVFSTPMSEATKTLIAS